MNDNDSLGEIFTFKGAYRDPDTHLCHFGVRWYTPDLGRWITEDPLLSIIAPKGAGALLPASEEFNNLYQYVGNNPINAADPFGLGKGKLVIRILRWVHGGSHRVTGRVFLGRPGGRLGPDQAGKHCKTRGVCWCICWLSKKYHS